MREVFCSVALIVLAACSGDSLSAVDTQNRLPPPVPRIDASSRVTSDAGGVPVLEVSAILRNPTTTVFKVATGPNCPLFVQLYPAPTGQYVGQLNGSMACSPSSPTFDLAPNDSVILTRTFRSDSLATYAPGNYGINVAVTTTTAVIGKMAGNVILPLSSVP
jgi:hypothetical protein